MPRPSSKVDKSVSIVSQTLQGLGTRLNVLERLQGATFVIHNNKELHTQCGCIKNNVYKPDLFP